MDGHTKYAQTYAHSEANRYEHEVTREARHGNANTGEGFESAESAKKPAAYIRCGTTCRTGVYLKCLFKICFVTHIPSLFKNP